LGIRYRRVPQIRFALAAVNRAWLVLEFFGTKLPHYILAAFPALAYLTASAIIRCLRGEDRDMESRPFQIGAACWALAAAGWRWAPGSLRRALDSGDSSAEFRISLHNHRRRLRLSLSRMAGVFVLITGRRFRAAMLSLGAG